MKYVFNIKIDICKLKLIQETKDKKKIFLHNSDHL